MDDIVPAFQAPAPHPVVWRCVACGTQVPLQRMTFCHGFAICPSCLPGLNTTMTEHLAAKFIHRDPHDLRTRTAA
jgi:hypothetical protein